MGGFNGQVGRHIDGVHRGYGVGQMNMEGRMLVELCWSNTWFKTEEKRNVSFRIGENETEIDFVFIKK